MKYKNIDSALHNFGQSFMSGMNYFDGDHVMYDVFKSVSGSAGGTLFINFSTGKCSPEDEVNNRIIKSVAHYATRLSKHLKSHDLVPDALTDVTLIVSSKGYGYDLHMEAIDDRGKTHRVYVNLA
jgi:hypothetical protein